MKKHFFITLTEIPNIAKKLAKLLRGGEILALIGELGSGKTTFAKALGRELKVKNKITSPSFILMNSFSAKLPKNNLQITLLHLDLYRTKNFKEVQSLGITELWQKNNCVTIIEWADKIKNNLPKTAWIINFDASKNR